MMRSGQRKEIAVKTILLHVQDNATLVPRLEAALDLARRFSAHLSCLHITPIEAYTAVGAFDGAILVADLRNALEEGEKALRQTISEQLEGEDVSWDYQQVTGHVATTLVHHAALSDLLVTGRESQFGQGRWALQIGLVGDLLHRCRTPLFIPPAANEKIDVSAPVLVAWDGSYEAANAIRASLSFLKAAPEVQVLHVAREAGEGEFPDTKALEYLSRHGVHAELRVASSQYDDVATLIVGEASSTGAGTIVLGGYNHSRIGELLFGGVTRSLLLDCPLPLLMAH